MAEIYAIALASMHQDMARLDRIASNLANATTPGFKREVIGLKPFGQVLEAVRAPAAPAGSRAAAAPAAATASATPTALQVRTDARPGTLRMTGQALDVAIVGEGFFEVMTDAGPAYTRQGDFRLDPRGRLVTARGDAVMGTNGEIVLATRSPVIDPEGRITEPDAAPGSTAAAPGTPVATLKLVRFDAPRELQRLGAGLVAPEGQAATVVSDGSVQLRQGALESSNVSAMDEMVQLIRTMRHFETMQKVAQGYDELLGTAIRKLGDLS